MIEPFLKLALGEDVRPRLVPIRCHIMEIIVNNDHKLKTDVTAELSYEPSLSADHIGVTAENGVVTLTGHVDAYWKKSAAERAAGRVKGVKAIAENMEVRLSGHPKRADDEIAQAALNTFSWNSSIPDDAVKVRVEKGVVTLTGEVPWRYQHDEVARTIRNLSGVTNVYNNLSVKKRPDTAKIQDDIGNALHRSWFSDDDVKVTAKGGEIHLTGHVESWADRQRAGTIAWRASGATSVDNDLRVA